MSYLLVQHTVKDYDTWRPYYDQHAATRADFGCTGDQVFQDAGDPNKITLLFEWDSFESADRFLKESNLAEVMQNAGVIGQPHVTFLNGA